MSAQTLNVLKHGTNAMPQLFDMNLVVSEFWEDIRGYFENNKPIERTLVYSGEDINNRQRYRPRQLMIYPYEQGSIDAPRSLMRAFYVQYLSDNGFHTMIKRFKLDQYIMYQEYCEKLSAIAKLAGNRLDENWRYLHGIDKIDVDYDSMTNEEIWQYASEWVNDKTHKWFGNEEDFNDRYRLAMRKALYTGSGATPDRIYDVSAFLKKPELWATTGSGFDGELKIGKVKNTYTHSKVKLVSSKWNQAWSNSFYKLKRAIWKRKKRLCKAFVKPEVNKPRLVVAVDFTFYLKCSFVDQLITKCMAGREDSTLFMRPKQIKELWLRRFRKEGLAFPLDEEKFDQAPSAAMRKIMLEELTLFVSDMSIHQEPKVIKQLNEMMDLIRYASEGGTLFAAGKKFDISGGIMSGERWTAFYDTMDNIAKAYMCRDMVQILTGKYPEIIDFCAQGDDQMNKISYKEEAALIICAMLEMNFKVNLRKVFIDWSRDEFLRKVLDKGYVIGYPARSVRSLFFRKFGKPELYDKIVPLRANQIVSGWVNLIRRFNKRFDTVQTYCIDDLHGATRCSRKDLKQWLFSCKTVGGAGLGNNVDNKLVFDSISWDYTFEQELEGLKEWIEYDKNTDLFVARNALYATMSVVDIIPKAPTWFNGIYAVRPSEYVKGAIMIGLDVRKWARKRNVPWAPTRYDVTHIWNYEATKKSLLQVQPKKTGLYAGMNRPKIKEDVTPFRAMTYKKIEKSIENYSAWKEELKHKPKRWKKDFLLNTTKVNIPVTMIPAYMYSEVANMANNWLDSKILASHRPTYQMYQNCLYSIENTLTRDLKIFDSDCDWIRE